MPTLLPCKPSSAGKVMPLPQHELANSSLPPFCASSALCWEGLSASALCRGGPASALCMGLSANALCREGLSVSALCKGGGLSASVLCRGGGGLSASARCREGLCEVPCVCTHHFVSTLANGCCLVPCVSAHLGTRCQQRNWARFLQQHTPVQCMPCVSVTCACEL